VSLLGKIGAVKPKLLALMVDLVMRNHVHHKLVNEIVSAPIPLPLKEHGLEDMMIAR
jgi:hypothetical protein